MKTAVKLLLATAISLLMYACKNDSGKKSPNAPVGSDMQQISALLDTFNASAARADYQTYFDCFDKDAIFMGTDATERWTKDSFAVWAKPFFDRGRAWNFTSIERHIYPAADGNTAWFDELLNTQMKICRGSGVVTRNNGKWKINQYVLSATIPNGILDTVVSMKSSVDDMLIREKTGQK
ncbi:MAG: nuclear transport factor 2 family protein [Bacteroidetes bacterium]|nr:nuclear transport factor 2 family protein [Bacteroidota bacterium]